MSLQKNSSTSANKRFANLIKNILEHYEELEKQTCNKILYYCHKEYDSNVTKFESLSNCNKIVLQTKLNQIYIPGIMLIFQAIYDDNYYMFENTNFVSNIYYDLDINVTEDVYKKLMSYENTDSWLKFLDLYNNLSCDVESDSESEFDIENNENNFIGNERVYDSLPIDDNDYYRGTQKIYTITSIKNLLNK